MPKPHISIAISLPPPPGGLLFETQLADTTAIILRLAPHHGSVSKSRTHAGIQVYTLYPSHGGRSGKLPSSRKPLRHPETMRKPAQTRPYRPFRSLQAAIPKPRSSVGCPRRPPQTRSHRNASFSFILEHLRAHTTGPGWYQTPGLRVFCQAWPTIYTYHTSTRMLSDIISLVELLQYTSRVDLPRTHSKRLFWMNLMVIRLQK